MTKICILDALALGNDIDLEPLQKFGDIEVYPVSTPEQAAQRIQDCGIVISNKVILNESNLKSHANLELICVAATGTNNIDLDYATKRGIAVCNVAGYSTQSVVQHTFSMLFYILGSSAYYDNYVKSGKYAVSDIFTHLDKPFNEVYGKTWGIIGMGTIGQAVGRVAREFGCRVIYTSTSGKNDQPEFTRVSLEQLLKEADVVSIHAPLNQNTLGLINYQKLQLMKANCILLNLGRGGIVNEADLARALDEGLIAGAGLDVLENEPIKDNNPLLTLKHPERLFITPHIAWASVEARQRLVREIAMNIEAFYAGAPRNKVN